MAATSIFCFYEGIHRNLHCWNGAQDHRFGPILLLSDRMEYFRWSHCYLKLNGTVFGECDWHVCPQIIQTGKSAEHLLVQLAWRKVRSDSLLLTVFFFVCVFIFNSWESSSWLNRGPLLTPWSKLLVIRSGLWATWLWCWPSSCSSLLWWACSCLEKATGTVCVESPTTACCPGGTWVTSSIHSSLCSECFVESG